nr:ribonuclease TUDOR 1-like [Tanacetum cinerariifolium]
MAQPAPSSQWLRGKVKAVLSGDTVLVMAFSNSGIPPEKTLSLAHLSAPRLAYIGGQDEPFAWDSREHLRNLCIGKVVFRAEYIIPGDILEFCSIYLGAMNVGNEVVARGWAKVSEAKGKVTPPDLLYLEEQARQQGVGLWNTSLASGIRKLPPSAVGDPRRTMGLLASNKGKPIKAIAEQVCDGSSVRAYLIPEFQYIQVCLAGIQAPSMGRIPQEISTSTEVPIDEPNPDAFGREAKHFTELCVLHRD